MKKDAYYFPHDSNAKDDPKCVMLIEELQLEGYGIYWVLIEILREQPNFKYPMKLIPSLARRFFTTKEKMLTVINNYGLFEIENGEFFYSESLICRMHSVNLKREKAVLAGKKSGEVRRMKAALFDEQVLNDRSTNVEQSFNKESKVKEIKEKESIYILQHHNLKLTEDEKAELTEKHGKKDVENMIKKIKSLSADYLRKYDSMYLIIDAWIEKEKENTGCKTNRGDNVIDMIMRSSGG